MTLETAHPDDAAAACALIAETDPPLFRHLGAGDIAFTLTLLDTLWRRGGTILGHDIARVARDARRVIGVLVAMPGREHQASHTGAGRRCGRRNRHSTNLRIDAWL